jgi:uncharacterized membrane protein
VNVSTDYAWLSILLSLAALMLLAWHLPRCIAAYKHHHDDRAAVSLAVAVCAIVASLGLLISGIGLLLNESQFSSSGIIMARGALLILAAVLVFADVRHAP